MATSAELPMTNSKGFRLSDMLGEFAMSERILAELM